MPEHLTHPLIQNFLAAQEIAILATLQQDGAPLCTPMWFLANAVSLYMFSVTNTQKVRNLKRDQRVCVVVETGTRGAEIRGVTVQGRVEFVDNTPALQPIVHQMLQKYDPHLAALWQGAIMPPNRCMWRIIPQKVYSWGLE